MKKTNYSTGHFAEKIALCFLCLKGYRPIAYNYTTGRGTGAGEIDLIVRHGHTLVFVEVKKRQNITTAGEAITHKNRQRVMRAAEVFLAKHPTYAKMDVRFDAVLFTHNFIPHHIPDAWRPL